MVEHKKDIIRDHTYDGIEEYDNALPLWWTALFIICIIFAALYVGYFHFGPGKVGTDRYAANVQAELERQMERSGGAPTEEVMRGWLADSSRIEKGRAVYFATKAECVTCHAESGLGQIGPNLRDDKWKWGSNLMDIFETLTNGRNGGAMPERKSRLSQDERVNLTLYLAHWNKTEKANGQGIPIAGEKDDPITY